MTSMTFGLTVMAFSPGQSIFAPTSSAERTRAIERSPTGSTKTAIAVRASEGVHADGDRHGSRRQHGDTHIDVHGDRTGALGRRPLNAGLNPTGRLRALLPANASKFDSSFVSSLPLWCGRSHQKFRSSSLLTTATTQRCQNLTNCLRPSVLVALHKMGGLLVLKGAGPELKI